MIETNSQNSNSESSSIYSYLKNYINYNFINLNLHSLGGRTEGCLFGQLSSLPSNFRNLKIPKTTVWKAFPETAPLWCAEY